ncbi:SusC/RagA family TonB-linked outer membrane protein [Arenibacter certesii]|uniref:SusC/RagA family TonB-linked outer membrane protein n=1 Tax=Arenibacter certesii TaxID=228955 RepID=A0A918MNN4_9FLAO|nr:TonB-dependent receptor [Arenibacter certesii]GGW42111.1 SusC/RagA family TonB-linked outer membrane protein [Arenibacter certesii]
MKKPYNILRGLWHLIIIDIQKGLPLLLSCSILLTTSGKLYSRSIENALNTIKVEKENKTKFSLQKNNQDIIVKGKVTDINGSPLPGASIVEKGTSNGTQTDFEGDFSIQVKNVNASLIVSYIGFETQEVPVDGGATISIKLEENAEGLEEVVVVGYGTQKKINLTGAISIIDDEELTKRPVNNVASMLQGKLSGVMINQGSGQPGKEMTSIRIRGTGTFSGAGSNPLVIIDGIAGSLDNIDPENVESISVLKDAASAAIYGARAANGVIVVTTKSGIKGDVIVNYHGNIASHSATILPDLINNSVEYMEMWNSAHTRQGIPNLFTSEQINAYKNASPGDSKFPNFNWLDHSIRSTPVQKHNLSVSGGTEKTNFYANIGYYDQEGIVIGHDFKKYSGQIKIDTKISDNLSFGANASMAIGDRKQPWLADSDFILLIYGSQPMYSPYLADGSGRYSHGGWPDKWVNRNPEFVANEGGDFYDSKNIRASAFLRLNILPELQWEVKGAIDYSDSFNKFVNYPIDSYAFSSNEWYSDGWPVFNGVRDQFERSNQPTLLSTLNYNKEFKNGHNLSILAGYNQESFKWRFLQGARRDFNFPQLRELNAGNSEGQNTTGSASEWAIQSYFGRITYNFKEKYLFEANARYDGTSRIFKENRWGLFPSLSAAWRVSQENFMREYDWVDNLKLRASWGQLGNQNIGNYPYQDVLSSANYPLGASLEQGLRQTRLTDKTLEWETTTSTDIGIDLSLGNGLLSMVFDWYKKDTEGILSTAEIPASVGLSAPTVNFASMQNSGIELLLGHRNKVGELSYSVDINYSKNKNEVTKVKAPSLGRQSTVEGKPINSYYMVEWDGIFQSQAEIDAAPVHPGNPQPGDLRFKDTNLDGVINADDRTFVDGAHPDFTYGGSISLQWKNWDLSVFFQGVEGQKYYLTWWGFWPFTQGTAPTTDWRNAWTPENQSQTMPALWSFSTYGNAAMSGTENTFDLHDASYMRIKNLQIGYNLPQNICEKINMKDIRVYFSGDNLITFSNLKNVDPERSGGNTRGSVYPQTKILSLGVKVKL